MVDRLVLGSAQLGMPYGINNKIGKPDFFSARDIVKTAFDNGIIRFDTAQAYGDSEEVLGKVFDDFKINSKVKIYSKLNPKLNLSDEFAVRQSVEDSLRKLKIDRLEGLLLHDENGLRFWAQGLGSILQSLVNEGKVKSIGGSFYTPQKASEALDLDGVGLVQVPANIFDRRFEEAGVFKKAGERGKEVFVRSIFLQGLLLAPIDCVPASLSYVLPYLERMEKLAESMKLTRAELSLGYAAQKWPGSFIIFGSESSKQVADNLRTFISKKTLKVDENIFKGVPENILNPALWSLS